MTNPPDREVAVFSAALRLSAGERTAYLDEACAGDAALRQHVEELLQASEKAGSFLKSPATSGQRIPPEPADLGRQFPQMEIIELLGVGGMGMVYKARQTKLERLVALKILPVENGRDTSFAERFGREAKALARLNHPGIVAVYEFGQTKDFYYLVMEFVDGMNLREYLQAAPLSPACALELVMQICTALQYAHDEQIVHRDIKPENILIDKKGRVKIADFGLAKLLDGQRESNLTAAKTIMGSINYMAPEQRERPLEVDHRADIYSLGVVFYEMLTGEVPMGHFEVPSKRVQVDVRLDEVVLHALEREPKRRYQKASEVRTGVETIASTMKPSGGQPATKFLSHRRRIVVQLAMVVAMFVIILGILTVGRYRNIRTNVAAGSVSQLGPRWTNSLGMVFVPVPGTSSAFSIWDTRVQDFDAFADETGYQPSPWSWTWRNGGHYVSSSWRNIELACGPTYPICGITWMDAHAFCHWLTEKEHKAGLLKPDLAYRLPTEAEWAVVFGDSLYPWGNQWPPPEGAGNYAGWTSLSKPGPKLTGTTPVGSYKPDFYGLYDIGGNVWQWSEDVFGDKHTDGVLRGGAWCENMSFNILSSARRKTFIDDTYEAQGFRCVISGVESNVVVAEPADPK
jgi:serine/threonine protein kinase